MVRKIALIGEIVYGNEGDTLAAIALGSCLALVLYDDRKIIAALAHVALPTINPFPNVKKNLDLSGKFGRYADTAIPQTIAVLKKQGAIISNLKAKVAGGSKMFGTLGLVGPGLNIGTRNIDKVKSLLKSSNIKIAGIEVGGETSRTVAFDVSSSILSIKKSSTRTQLFI